MPHVEVTTGERVDTVYRNRTVSTVVVTIAGRRFVTDCKDGVDALNVAVQTARLLGARLGLEP